MISRTTIGRSAIGFVAVGALLLVAAPEGANAQAQALHIAATVNPNPPKVGDNMVDLQVTDATDTPAVGVKLSASVSMTSMDMGTTHPAVRDMGQGHYRVTATFSMAGPWRVVLKSGAGKSVLDFDAGGKTVWKSSPVTISGTSSGAKPLAGAGSGSPTKSSMDNMGGPGYGPNGRPASTSGMEMSGGKMTGMEMGGGGEINMKPLKMPQLQEQRTYIATGKEDWKVRTGFGKNTGVVAMMSQMMVGGSGMEGMKMAPMKMTFDEQNFTEESADADNGGAPTEGGDGKPVPEMPMNGLPTAGDNGTGKLIEPVQPSTPPPAAAGGTSGSMSEAKPVAASTSLKIVATIVNPKSGDNSLVITVADASGAPVMGAKISTSVAMTSMDMGTAHPEAKEIGKGKYRATVNFSMSGPWRVTVRVASPGGGATQKKAFDFNAK